MEDYVNLSDLIKSYDDYKDNISNDDNLYYNDTIINYDIM